MELQVRTEKVVGFSSACVMNQPLGKYSACVPAQMGRAVRTQPCTAVLRVTARVLLTPGLGAENTSHLALTPSLVEADFLLGRAEGLESVRVTCSQQYLA